MEFIGAFCTAECFYMMGIEQTLPQVQVLRNNSVHRVHAGLKCSPMSTGPQVDSWVRVRGLP